MTHREHILSRLRDRSHTQKELLYGAGQRGDRDDRYFTIRDLEKEGLIEIISRKPAIAPGGTAIGFKQTRYALTDAGRVAADVELQIETAEGL